MNTLSVAFSNRMGLKSGKYKVERGNSIKNEKEIFSFGSNESRKEKASLPKFIHQNLLTPNITDLALVWLDTEINNQPSNIDTQIKLKNLINYLRIFDKVNACEHYIKQIGQINKGKVLVIISTTLALKIIPHLHEFPQVKYIYIHGESKAKHKISPQFFKKYTKVDVILHRKKFYFSRMS